MNLIDFGLNDYYKAIPNIDRACSTVIENSIALFLPFKRLDKSDLQKKFDANNRTLEIDNNMFDKVEIKGRLLGQTHKDILEILLTSKKSYSKTSAQFKIKTTAYDVTNKLNRNLGKKKWLIDKIDEIAESRIKIFYTNGKDESVTFNFAFISSIKTVNQNEIEISFTPEYTYFLIKNELLDYSNYIDDIMQLEEDIKLAQKQIGLKRGININFIKSVVRYMLVHNGKNSQISIANLIEKLKLSNIMTTRELEENVVDLKRPIVQDLLRNKFGMTLTNNGNTISFNAPASKAHYHIKEKI